jgi:CubicO group peptidase (beta-lactamase class C family)
MLIIKDGKIAVEKYFNGYTKNSAHLVRSVSKSFLSATYGIAIEKSILNLNDKIMDYLSEFSKFVIDNRYNTITIQDLLKMRGGLENDRTAYFKVFNSKNWIKTTFEMGLKYSPGSKYSYSTPGAHLLSAVLTEASGSSSKKFVESNLIKPMNITLEDWERDPQGYYFGGNNMYFTSRNMASFGLMYLNDGILNGKQIVTKEWVQKSLTDYTDGLGDWGELKNIGYGLFWWLGEMDSKKVFTAIGHGGQFIMCIPSLEMIIVTTANSNIYWEEADKQETKIMEIMSKYFIEAAK